MALSRPRALALIVVVVVALLLLAAHPEHHYIARHDPDTPILRARERHGIPSSILVTLSRHDSLLQSLHAVCQFRARFPEFHLALVAVPVARSLPAHCGLHVSSIHYEPSEPDFSRALSQLSHLTAPDIHVHCYSSSATRISTAHSSATLIQIPCSELQYASWLGMLSPMEWHHWHTPRIQLSIITNDRPQSLARLLRSVHSSLYFGDSVSLHINMEQTADTTTRFLVHNFTWPNGDLHLRHRVIRGGLLPAVVESWYPHDNRTYGVLLEDDVEVSPLFYAWLKMAILRYRLGFMSTEAPLKSHPEPRYGDQASRATSLFGISLYQQKNTELHPTGRREFHAPSIISQSGFPDIYSPYLSQVPCSWGAAFFPEHWREFHDYLILRLSETTHDLSENIVPDVRSNRWRRSWKKYFIEMVHLRGYVMLYPNFPNYMSLSTNHLEIGSHVKKMPDATYELKKSLFNVPLMHLDEPTLLTDFPNGALPQWTELPVLDLLGFVTTETELKNVGNDRRLQVSGCSWDTSAPNTYDARELFCIGKEREEIP